MRVCDRRQAPPAGPRTAPRCPSAGPEAHVRPPAPSIPRQAGSRFRGELRETPRRGARRVEHVARGLLSGCHRAWFGGSPDIAVASRGRGTSGLRCRAPARSGRRSGTDLNHERDEFFFAVSTSTGNANRRGRPPLTSWIVRRSFRGVAARRVQYTGVQDGETNTLRGRRRLARACSGGRITGSRHGWPG